MRLEALYDAPGLPSFDLPVELAEAYDGGLGFSRPRLVANFVATIDGVVAIPDLPQSNKLISRESESDRFVMGLLRAAADAVLVGSGTLRASPRGLWTAEQTYPDAASAFAVLRTGLGLPPAPERVVVTGSGDLPDSHPVFEDGALVLTTETGESRLSGRLPAATTVVSLGEGEAVDPAAAIAELHERGHQLILSEAGPHLFGSLVEAGLVDALDPDLDRGLGLDAAVLALLGDHPPGLEPEQRLVLSGILADEQVEGPVGSLELVAAVLELLDALDHA